MSRDFHQLHLFTGQLERHWQELLELTSACAQESLVDPKLLQYELTELKSRISDAKSSGDQAKQEGCLEQCQRLLAYYAALRKQVQSAGEADALKQDAQPGKPLLEN